MNHKTIFMAFVLMALTAAFTTCETTPETPALQPPTLISPADGSTPAQNPPVFIWHTVEEESIAYVLEVANDPLFIFPFVCISAEIVPPDTQYQAETTLEPGRYYWRICTRENC